MTPLIATVRRHAADGHSDLSRLKRNFWRGLLSDPLHRSARSVRLLDRSLWIEKAGRRSEHSLERLSSAPTVRKRFSGASVTFSFDGASPIEFVGARLQESIAFARDVERAWVELNVARLSQEAERLDRILRAVEGLRSPRRYPAACETTEVVPVPWTVWRLR